MTRVRPKIGDVCEISTPKGFAYFHHTHKHIEYGHLIRIIPGIFDVRPVDFIPLIKCPSQFVTFYPLGVACAQHLITIVANLPVPASSSSFPLFRTGLPDVDGTVNTWWLWNGVNAEKIGSLRSDMVHLPLRGIVTHPFLIDRIISGYCDSTAT